MFICVDWFEEDELRDFRIAVIETKYSRDKAKLCPDVGELICSYKAPSAYANRGQLFILSGVAD